MQLWPPCSVNISLAAILLPLTKYTNKNTCVCEDTRDWVGLIKNNTRIPVFCNFVSWLLIDYQQGTYYCIFVFASEYQFATPSMVAGPQRVQVKPDKNAVTGNVTLFTYRCRSDTTGNVHVLIVLLPLGPGRECAGSSSSSASK